MSTPFSLSLSNFPEHRVTESIATRSGPGTRARQKASMKTRPPKNIFEAIGLPQNSMLRKFDLHRFRTTVGSKVDEIIRLRRLLLWKVREEGGVPSLATSEPTAESYERNQHAKEISGEMLTLLIQLDDLLDSQHIVNFLPKQSPGNAADELYWFAFLAELAIIIFRRAYPTVRQVIMDFVDQRRRDVFHAFDPLVGDLNGTKFPPRILEGTKNFNGIFARTTHMATQFIVTLMMLSKPIRRRIADDTAFLEAVALSTLAQHVVYTVLYLREPCLNPVAAWNSFRESVVFRLEILKHAVLENPRPWRRNLTDVNDLNGFNVASFFVDQLKSLRVAVATLADWKLETPKQFGPSNVQHIDEAINIFTISFLKPTATATLQEFQYYDAKRSILLTCAAPDSCDRCGRIEGGSGRRRTRMRKCGGCRVARYCSEVCAREDWEDGHRKRCYWANHEA